MTLKPHVISSNPIPPQVLYALLQQQNTELTIDQSDITFGTPQLNTQAQATANGNTTSNVELSAVGYNSPVTIYYNQVNVANSAIPPSTFGIAVPTIVAPVGTYASTTDFTAALNAAGIPVTSADIEPVELFDFWQNDYSDFSYPLLGAQLVTWSNTALGFTSSVFVLYGPSAPVSLAAAFPSQYNNLFGSYESGDPANCLSRYNQAYLSGQQNSGWTEGFGAQISRLSTSYSNLTTLDDATSQTYGGANSSALVTYLSTANPNYIKPPFDTPQYFWPYYEGSQTVYYSRWAATDVSDIFGGPFLDSGVFTIPLGSLLGTTITNAQQLFSYLVANGWTTYLDYTDFSNDTLPAYGEGGTVVFDFNFQGSYAVLDGQCPVTLSQTGPDMSAVVGGVVDFPTSTMQGNWGYYFSAANTTLASAVTSWWSSNYPSTVGYASNDVTNWTYGLTATVVEGSVQATTSDVAAAQQGCGFQAIIEVTAPWGSTFQQQIYYDKINLANLATVIDTSGNSSVGTLLLQAPASVFAAPQRVVDWLLNTALTITSTPPVQVTLTNYINYQELSNLTDLVMLDENGQLSFTVTADENSPFMEGSLTIVIENTTSNMIGNSPTYFDTIGEGGGWPLQLNVQM
jgi:hypothetical protein